VFWDVNAEEYFSWTAWPWKWRETPTFETSKSYLPNDTAWHACHVTLHLCLLPHKDGYFQSLCWWYIDLAGILQCRPSAPYRTVCVGWRHNTFRQRLSEVICLFINSYFYSQTQQRTESINIFTKGKWNIARRIMQLIFGEDRANLEGNIFACAVLLNIRCCMFMPAVTVALLNHHSYIYDKCAHHKLIRVYRLRLRPKCWLVAREKVLLATRDL